MVVQGNRDSLVLSDVLVGDVWLASGQSNMEFGIQTDSRAAESILQAKDSFIRFFYVPMAKSLETQSEIGHPASDPDGKWVVCSPALLASKWAWHGFSAVGYYFAQRMRAVTRGPVGVIGSYKGGTPAQAWMSLSALEADTAFRRHVVARQKVMADSASAFSTPGNLFNAMIAPLISYGIKGVIWYQGESNGDRLADALEYKALFPALIRDWRKKWGRGQFSFPVCATAQLPGAGQDAVRRELDLGPGSPTRCLVPSPDRHGRHHRPGR
jgi:sialate O-acetylesterase